MGASEWRYFVPYQEDIEKAFRELREQVFRDGEYYVGGRLEDEPAFATVEELLEWNETEGTHSILDMWAVSHNPADPPSLFRWMRRKAEEGETIENPALHEEMMKRTGLVTPLSDEQLMALFRTTRPTRAAVEGEKARRQYGELRDRWEGIFIVVYKDDTPDEIFFTGYSGD